MARIMNQSKRAAQDRPARKRRRLRRFLVLLVIIALGSYWLLLPGLVHGTILRKLSAVGVTDATFDLRHVSWWRVHAANMRLGRPPWARIGAVDVGYGLGGILFGDPHTVEVTGAQWTVQVGNGTIDLGPARGGQGESRNLEALPFERVEIRSSAVVVEGLARTLRLPIEGAVVRLDGGRWRADLRLGAAAQPIAVQAVLKGSLPSGKADIEIGGQLTLEIAGREIDARGIRLTLGTPAVDDANPPSLQADLRVEEIDVGAEQLRDVAVAVRRVGDDLAFEGAAACPRWRLSVHSGRLPAAPADGQAPRVGTALWEMAGHLPAAAAAFLSEQEIDVEDLGRVTVKGRTSVHLSSSSEDPTVAPGWRLELSDVHAQLEPGDLALRRPGVLFEGLSGDIVLSGAIGPTGAVLNLRPDTTIDVTRITGPGFRSGPVHAVAAPRDHHPFASATLGGDGVTADISFEMSAGHAVSLDAGGADASLGSLALDGHLRIDGNRMVPDLQLTFTDAGLRHRHWNVEAEGISGSLRFKGLAPMSTPGGQRIVIEQARFGKLGLADGLVLFTIERPDSVLVERAEWRVAGGTRVRTMPFRFDPGAPVISTEVYAENIALSEWLPLLTDDRATGDGVVYGRLAVTLRPVGPGRLLTLGEGYLYAAPGRGWFAVRDVTMLETVLEGSLAGADHDGYQDQIKRRLVEALQDFEYSQLRVELIEEGEEVLCRAATSGKGRRGDDPQEIEELVIRIHDFNGVLNDLLSLRSAVDRAAEEGGDPSPGPPPAGVEP
jgi:hypothetical protein